MSKTISGLLGISKNVIKWSALRIAIGITALFLIISSSASATPINDCTTISSPGSYELTQNIGNSANSVFCIAITSSDVVFDGAGFMIDGTDAAVSTYGVYVYNPSTTLTNVTLKNSIVNKWKIGVNYSNVQNGSIDNNIVSNSNDFYVYNVGYGIYLYSSNNIILSKNIVYFNRNGGIYLLSSNNNVISNNNANSNTNGGIHLLTSNNNTLNNNIVYDNSYGNGIDLQTSNNNIVINNIANNTNQMGIALTRSSNNTITGNNISNQYSSAIYLTVYSNDNILSYNKVFHNYRGDGIYMMDFSSKNVLIGNNISYTVRGFALSRSSNNTLRENNASNNGVGISIQFQSNDNSIYNNYFNNSNNFNGYMSSNNTWNTIKTLGTNIISGPYLGGNVWSIPSSMGYSNICNDENDDGICDSTRTLDASNVDYLPLVDRPVITPTPTPTQTLTPTVTQTPTPTPTPTVTSFPPPNPTPTPTSRFTPEVAAWDTNHDDVIQKIEAVNAIVAYFSGTIAKANAISVVIAYFSS